MEYSITEDGGVQMPTTLTIDSGMSTTGVSEGNFTTGSTGSDSEPNGYMEPDSNSYVLFFPLKAATERPDADFWGSSTSPIADLLAYGIIPISPTNGSTSGSTGLSPEEVEL